MYDIERRELEPKNFFAGDFPTLTESGTAGAEIKEYMPVAKNADGQIIPFKKAPEPASATTENVVIGISATSAATGDPVVYYMTGEFFAEAINLPDDVDMKTLKDECRKVSIFLRDGGKPLEK